ncbi:MAG: hypothetical protein DRQ41_09725 [Gammaproteobacteria bacterium]|nr:MAG: hypothetical protein DRQ41_09725 [Gammaproteobacteria bacterium]
MLFSGFVINAYAGKIYRCHDEQGNIQYTQTPSPACQEEIKFKSAQSDTPEAVLNESQVEEEETAPSDQAATSLVEKCKIVRQNLAVLNSKNQVSKSDPKNPEKFIILTEEQRLQEREKIRYYIDKNCFTSASEE